VSLGETVHDLLGVEDVGVLGVGVVEVVVVVLGCGAGSGGSQPLAVPLVVGIVVVLQVLLLDIIALKYGPALLGPKVVTGLLPFHTAKK
jgi:hypothetical protein